MMSVTFWKEHLLIILLSDFVQSCMPRECFYVQSLMNAFMVQTSIMGRLQCKDSAVCAISLCWPLKPVHAINTHLYNVTAVLLSFTVVRGSRESVNLVYLVDTFIWHDAIIWNVRIFDAGGYYINGSVHFFFFTVYLIKHWKIIHVFSLSLKYI